MDILIIAAGIIIALMFNFVNGLNDAANNIAPAIATRALSPIQAIALAGIFNFLGPIVFSTAIAKTIGKGIVDPTFLTIHVILIGLIGAVLWVFSCSMFGIPVSSSHALVGGILGSGIAAGGITAILWPDIYTVKFLLLAMMIGGIISATILVAIKTKKEEDWRRTLVLGFLTGVSLIVPILMVTGVVEIKGIFAIVIFIIISPTLGFIAAYFFALLIMRFFRNKNPVRLNSGFNRLQILSVAFQSIGHGANDAQNAMGVITAMLVAAGILSEFVVPLWVIIASCAAIAIGTLAGGWRVIDKMAKRITKIRPYQGFSASVASGGVLALMTSFGVPVSTTHAITGSIMGVGSTRGYNAVKWGVVREIVAAWVLTIPASSFVSGCCYLIYSSMFM